MPKEIRDLLILILAFVIAGTILFQSFGMMYPIGLIPSESSTSNRTHYLVLRPFSPKFSGRFDVQIPVNLAVLPTDDLSYRKVGRVDK